MEEVVEVVVEVMFEGGDERSRGVRREGSDVDVGKLICRGMTEGIVLTANAGRLLLGAAC